VRLQFKETDRGGGGGGRSLQYILKDRNTLVPAETLEWAFWMEVERRKPVGESLWRVGHNELVDGYLVSTVFLGLDHRFGFNGPPIVFETMAFMPMKRLHKDWIVMGRALRRKGQRSQGHEILQWRYSTWAEAEAGHAKAVRLVRKYRVKLNAARASGDKRMHSRVMWKIEEAL
jgi:hypothetical protein